MRPDLSAAFVEIATTHGPERREAFAVIGPFAVTRHIVEFRVPPPDFVGFMERTVRGTYAVARGWTITHLATGRTLGRVFIHPEDAELWVRALCDALTGRQLIKLERDDAELATKILRRPVGVADEAFPPDDRAPGGASNDIHPEEGDDE